MTTMTPDSTINLGILDPDFMARMGEPPASIAYAQTRRLDEIAPIRDAEITEAADRIEAGEPLLDVFAKLCHVPMEKL